MFIYNFRINGSKVFKVFFTFLTLLLVFILVFVTYKIFYGAKHAQEACVPPNDIFNIEAKNYTNVLKTVHDDLDQYIGMKLNLTGYVYRMPDFKDNQFVLARNMIISSDYNYVVVGFLSENDNGKNFKDGNWVNVTGYITKGDYHGDIPVLKVTEIKLCEKPTDAFVFPPDENYIPTSSWV